jgi:hypothetical protein
MIKKLIPHIENRFPVKFKSVENKLITFYLLELEYWVYVEIQQFINDYLGKKYFVGLVTFADFKRFSQSKIDYMKMQKEVLKILKERLIGIKIMVHKKTYLIESVIMVGENIFINCCPTKGKANFKYPLVDNMIVRLYGTGIQFNWADKE